MISDNSHLIVVNKTEGFRDCFTIPLFPARELMAHLHRKRIGAVRETAEKSSAFSTRCIVSPGSPPIFIETPSAFIPRREALISSVVNGAKVFFFLSFFFFFFNRASINLVSTHPLIFLSIAAFTVNLTSPSISSGGVLKMRNDGGGE